jgi:hypothetical protein
MTTAKHLPRPERLTSLRMDMQTLVTGLGRVARINQDQLHPKLDALVFQKPSQLEKCPTIGASAFRFAAGQSIGALSNSSQVFERNRLVVLFGVLNQSIADGVIHL